MNGAASMRLNDESSLDPTSASQSAAEPLDALVATLYGELHEIAHRHRMARDPASSLATTALVHEAYLKLAGGSNASWKTRVHFLSVAAIAMRHLLVDRAKARNAAKRGGGDADITFDEELLDLGDDPSALLQLDEALTRLADVDSRLCRIVEYKFFGGLTHEEIAEALGIAVRTVERSWVKARLLLRDDLTA